MIRVLRTLDFFIYILYYNQRLWYIGYGEVLGFGILVEMSKDWRIVIEEVGLQGNVVFFGLVKEVFKV